jgi:hypothetical protein
VCGALPRAEQQGKWTRLVCPNWFPRRGRPKSDKKYCSPGRYRNNLHSAICTWNKDIVEKDPDDVKVSDGPRCQCGLLLPCYCQGSRAARLAEICTSRKEWTTP